MKMKPIFLFLSLVLLCACSSNEELVTIEQHSGSALELSVSAGNFVTRGDTPATRATDNGKDIIFVENDRVGVIVLEGSDLKGNNLPYIYNGTSWSFDTQTVNSENTPGKSRYYYDNQATNVTYIVYFPYSKDADNITSIEGAGGLKDKFKPKEDQQLEADYRASDLMTWTSGSVAPLKKLTVPLSHAYNSISLLPEVHYTLVDGKNTDFVNPSAISDVNFTLGAKTIYPFPASDGSYRYILSSDFAGSVTCHYTFDGKTYDKALTVSASTPPSSSNIRYSSTQRIDAGTYSLDKARVGDFYCRADNGDGTTTGYLIPGAAAMPTAEDKARVIGIVYKTGNPTDTDATTNGDAQLATDHSGCTHGWVVGIKILESDGTAAESGFMKWSDPSADINDWAKTDSHYSGYTDGDIRSENKRNGYSNTKVLDAYNQQLSGDDVKYQVVPANAVSLFRTNNAASSSSSDWYLPSKQELLDLCNARNAVGSQLSKISGDGFGNDYYWSSTEFSASRAWYVDFYRAGQGTYDKLGDSRKLRPVLAF